MGATAGVTCCDARTPKLDLSGLRLSSLALVKDSIATRPWSNLTAFRLLTCGFEETPEQITKELAAFVCVAAPVQSLCLGKPYSLEAWIAATPGLVQLELRRPFQAFLQEHDIERVADWPLLQSLRVDELLPHQRLSLFERLYAVLTTRYGRERAMQMCDPKTQNVFARLNRRASLRLRSGDKTVTAAKLD